MEILIGIATSVASLVIGRWLGQKDAQKLRRDIGDDFDQKLRQWRTEGAIGPVRNPQGEITGITGRKDVVLQVPMTASLSVQDPAGAGEVIHQPSTRSRGAWSGADNES